MAECPDLRALEGDVTPAVREHLAGCASCQIVVQLLDERNRGIAARDRRDECARFEMLLAARNEGTIGGTAGALLDAHLRECGDCQAVAATLPPVSDRGEHSMLPAVSTASYALGREVARGGMGRILAAEDLRIGRPVAVKELLGKGPALAARFEREARVTARLQHPGILPIYEIGKWPDGTPFYAMRMVEGRTLREAIREMNTLGQRLALLPAVIAAAEAVAFAHDRRIIHRDLTPNNVLVGAHGDTVVIDWGLAKDLSAQASAEEDVAAGPYRDEPTTVGNLTTVGAVIGTAAYMPPEQARGESVDERADVYALGAILYHVLAGTPPYRASESEDIVRQVQGGPPAAIHEVAPGAPSDLLSIVAKSMSRDPAGRYPSADELVEELRRFQTGRLVEAHQYSRVERMRRWVRDHRVAVFATAAALLTVSVAGTVGLVGVLQERDRADSERRAAVEQRLAAAHTTTMLLEELGRQELLANHPGRALALLSASYSSGDTSMALRFLLRSAMRNLESVERTLVGTADHALLVRFSSDGAHLLVVRQAVIEQWRVEDGTREASYPVLNFEQGRVQFSADGRRFVAYYAEGVTHDQLRVWDMEQRALVRAVDEHDVGYAGLSPDGRRVVVLGRDGHMRVWDLGRGTMTSDARVGPAGCRGRLTRDGSHLVVASGATQVSVWDWQANTRVAVLEHGARLSDVLALVAAPDAAHVVTCGGGTATKLWDGRTGKLVAAMPPVSPGEVLVCAYVDARTVATTSDDGYFSIANPADGRPTVTWKLSDGPALALPTSDGARVLVDTAAGVDRFSVRDTETGTVLATFDGVQGDWVATPRGDRMAVAQADGSVQIVNPRPGRLRSRLSLRGAAGEVIGDVSSDLRHAVTWESNGTMKVWDVATGAAVPTPELRPPVSISGDATKLVARAADGSTIIVDLATGTIATTLATAPGASHFALDEHAHRLVVLSPTEPSQVWDVSAGRLLKTVPGPAANNSIALLDASGRHLLTVQQFGDAQLQDLEGDPHPITLAHAAFFMAMGFTRDGRRFGLVNDSGEFCVFDSTSGALVVKRPGGFAAFDRTGDRVVISADGGMQFGAVSDPDAYVLIAAGTSMRSIAVGLTPDASFILSAGGVWSTDGRALAAFTPAAERANDRIPGIDRTGGYELGNVAIAHDGSAGATFAKAEGVSVWDLSVEDRSPEEIARFVAAHVPWRVEDGRLVTARFPSARLHGRVTRHGAPVVAEMRVLDTNHAALSSSDGHYAPDQLMAGTIKVLAVTQDRMAFARPRELTLGAGDNALDLELDISGSISGRVVDVRGVALAGVAVHAECVGCREADGGDAVTNPDGAFTIGALLGGSYRLTVRAASTSGREPVDEFRLRSPSEFVVSDASAHVAGVRLELAQP
jgi:WD40 repeat protein